MSHNSMQALPADFFHLLCAELSDRLDFPTLYNLAVSSKDLANSGSIAALYRISHQSPLKGGGSEGPSLAELDLIVQRWSILWRSIALSAFDKTLYPYCRYLRSLDLRDLGNLLDDDKFRGKISKHFFTNELAKFHFTQEIPAKRRIVRLDSKRIIAAIGNEITTNAPLVESISEPTDSDVLSNVLPDWAPRLTNLRSLELWDGKVFADETVRNLLHTYCPHLSLLRIYNSRSPDSDHNLAAFISGMQENSLTYFENIRECGIAAETCLALSSHRQSLRTLKLFLTEEGVLALGFLRSCTSLERLTIDALRGGLELEATQNDVYLELVEWLKNCRVLQELSFNNFSSAPNLTLPLLLNKANSIQSLEITGREVSLYQVKDHRDFHQALGAHTELRQLILHADPESMVRDDTEVLINSICSLHNLRVLKLVRISDFFSDEHICLLAHHLHNLEDFLVGGYGISDAIWPSMGMLKGLKTVTFNGITTFTAKGIKAFIDHLGEGNFGLTLSVDAADPDSGILPEEQEQLRDLLAEKVNGRFDYQLLRDPNVSEFDTEDSD